MKVDPIKTHQITTKDNNIFDIIDQYVTSFEEQSILVITSKIISICQGNLIKIEDVDKKHLIEQESDYFLPPKSSKYNITLTIKDNLLTPTF